ncbi:translocation/assembly module TamB domain-containing protein [Sphingomonas nostoxanthinifaciens]|uniref:translocation/assembly module TamB domain-containing protein n=1 Tax=Sphingomonas nostoxanthinifaciens TaxID=2872652 RepID=UPI001CC1E43C|nr:translocation/assembly module TamB domain-containing protein [Sphingomonas nostoxanthinifaciens]UAK24666.1 translocation/assembly module TamB domain-containing protein [Sphingomonas nostoxanthinifaciens]
MTAEDAPAVPPRRRKRWLRGIATAFVLVLAVLAAALWGIDTGPGHRLIASRIAKLRPSTGLRIRIGRIDGTIWRHATLRNVELYDLNGRFFAAPEIALDWHLLAWLHNQLSVDRLVAPVVTLDRAPHLRSRPNQPLLPGFDIRIGQLAIGRAMLGPALTGRPQVVRLAARADVRGQRALIELRLASHAGDRLLLDLDAEPDGDSFHLAGEAHGPADGTLAGLIGRHDAVEVAIGGRGGFHAWNGTARATLGRTPVAVLALGVRDGRYLLGGTLAPAPFLSGKAQRLTSPRVRVQGAATLKQRVLNGTLHLATPALTVATQGAIDLARSAFSGVRIDAHLLQPNALFPNMSGSDVHLRVDLDGPFRSAAFRYALASPHVAFDKTGFDRLLIAGAGRVSRLPLALPIRVSAARVTGVDAQTGGILANLSVAGVLRVDAKTVTGSDLALASDKLRGKLALRLDLVTGHFDAAVTGGLTRYLIPGLGVVDVTTTANIVPGPDGRGTIVQGTGQAIVRRLDNLFLRGLAGGEPRIDTKLVRSADGLLHLTDLVLTGPAIRLTGSGLRRLDGSFQLDATGTQKVYGPFHLNLDGMIDHPQVRLQLASPVPALGLSNVALDLDPVPEGFQFRAGGGSTLGRFTAHGLIHAPPNQPAVIDVADLAVTGTHAQGTLRSGEAGTFDGRLDLAGGGISGTLGFALQDRLQRIDPQLRFAGATLATDEAVAVRKGSLDGAILLDPAGVGLDLRLAANGLARGGWSLSSASVTTKLRAGRGTVGFAAKGAGGRSFAVSGTADVAPERIAFTGQGNVVGKSIKLDGPAVLTAHGSGWALAETRLLYAGGSAGMSGIFGADQTSLDATLDHLPLSLADLVKPRLSLGGYASGRLSYRAVGAGPPTGRVDVAIRGLTRSSLVLSSTPADLALAAVLTPTGAAARAVIVSNGRTIGRAQARLTPLAAGATLAERLTKAPLFAQLRYGGPADTLWRLLGVGTIDLSGPLSITADVDGTLAVPLIRGSLATDNGRLESAVTGTVIDGLKAAGRFDGSRLLLDSYGGRVGTGTVAGRGSLTFGTGGALALDLSMQADKAAIINRDDIAATVTGPITIRSDTKGGVVGGQVDVVRGRFRLGSATGAQLPRLSVTDVNRPDSEDDAAPPLVPWTLDVKAHARNQLMVSGLGLDSEWRADLTLKGAVDNPAIGGRLDLVRGVYQFAGRRFDLDRGMIRFSGDAPPDPVIDITAVANVDALNANIHVTGTGLHPEIHFESTPALPEDELLSRLLFGSSIANLSAPEALQLASAVASLRGTGGGGMNLDPINAVRRAVRLDRLRILPADPTTGQKTAVAAGKYLGRRTYVELITDGQGYSATSIEYRITRWLSVLSTVSTVGRQSANLKVSKDY